MVTNIAGLRTTLEGLAQKTWTDIADGRHLGVPVGEVYITDQNMLALRRELPSLVVYKWASRYEALTGADWEWWLDTGDGWICLVFQAKLLYANGRYAAITERLEDGKPQVEVLLHHCLRRSERLDGAVWPLYCFYNSWHGDWPGDIPRFDGVDPSIMSTEELRLYGCAVVDAWSVRRVLLDPRYNRRRTLRDSYLPMSRPWSMIFSDPTKARAYSPTETMMILSSWIFGRSQLVPPPPPSEPGEVGYVPARRRDRLAIYRDPALVERPPPYVLDLLEGRVHLGRLRPLAHRVVILPASDLGG